MTLPYCCHIISQIEIEYNSQSDLPKWLIHSFKNPRIIKKPIEYGERQKHIKSEDLKHLYSICDSFLHNHGYSLKHLYNYQWNDDKATQSLSDCTATQDSLINDHKLSQSGVSSDSECEISILTENTNKSEFQGIVKSVLQNMISKTMVYYLSLYEEFSKNYDLLNISRKSSSISKNSTYEMISGLRDCMSHLYESGDKENEAIIITNDYSGIFSSNDIMITRSNMTFRKMLTEKEIEYLTIYDEIKSYSMTTPLLESSQSDLSQLVSSYLTNTFSPEEKKMNESQYSQDLTQNKENFPKTYLLKSLKLPTSEEYDLNVLRITGRSNCGKLLKLLEKMSMNNLLSMTTEKLCNVRLILTNFPTLFSKVNQTRFSFTREGGSSKMVIRGIIMPSVLMNSFNIIKILENKEIVKKPTINVKYNMTFDAEMYEKTLRIAENRIYQQFIKNYLEIREKYSYTYKALKKLVPFNRFKMHKGRVAVFPHSSKYELEEKGEKMLELENKSRSKSMELALAEWKVSSDVVVVRDTLYLSLAKIKVYLSNMEGTSQVMKKSTKAFLDESLEKVQYKNLKELEFEDRAKCTIELYPNSQKMTEKLTNEVESQTDKEELTNDVNGVEVNKSKGDLVGEVLSRMFPNNLTNIIWMLSYLLHCSGQGGFYERKTLENITNYDIYNLRVRDNPLERERKTGKLGVKDSLNFPLAQQSYIVHVVNHVKFNREFHKTFKVKYSDYVQNSNLNIKVFETEKMEMMEKELNLNTGWKNYFKQKSESSEELKENKENTDNEDKTNLVDLDKERENGLNDQDNMLQKEEKKRKKRKTANETESLNKRNKSKGRQMVSTEGLLKPSYNPISVSKTHEVEFGKVYASSRKYGRVHQCMFDFDSLTTFDDMYYSENYNMVEEINKIIQRETNFEKAETVHFIVIFLFSNNPSIKECVNLKTFKDVLDSNLVKFSNKEMNYDLMDLNKLDQVNVLKFRDLFTNNEFGLGTAIRTKNGVSYSLLGSDFTVNEIGGIVNKVERETSIKMIGVPLGEGELELFSKSSTKIIKTYNMIGREYKSSLEFVDMKWIFDSYFEGLLDMNLIPEEYVLKYNLGNASQYSLEDFSIQDFKEDISSNLRFTLDHLKEYSSSQNNLLSQESNAEALYRSNTTFEFMKDESLAKYNCSMETIRGDSKEYTLPLTDLKDEEKHSLKFRESYKTIKSLWGWNVYVLSGSDLGIRNEDCTLYRKHCGIRIKRFKEKTQIKSDIETTISQSLEKFNISEHDLEEFFTHERILTNTVIISEKGDLPDRTRLSKNCVRPSIGSKKICLGGYEGIPVLSHKWFVYTLNENLDFNSE